MFLWGKNISFSLAHPLRPSIRRIGNPVSLYSFLSKRISHISPYPTLRLAVFHSPADSTTRFSGLFRIFPTTAQIARPSCRLPYWGHTERIHPCAAAWSFIPFPVSPTQWPVYSQAFSELRKKTGTLWTDLPGMLFGENCPAHWMKLSGMIMILWHSLPIFCGTPMPPAF